MSKLGAPQRTRLLTYAKCALRGLSVEAGSEPGDAAILVMMHQSSLNRCCDRW